MKYEHFLKKYGFRTKDSSEDGVLVLSYQDAKKALNYLRDENLVIWGGEIYTDNSDSVIDHAFNVLGANYHCFDWSYDEENDDNSVRSIEIANVSIEHAKKIINKIIYINLIL